jgi:hypothetical protein
VLLEDPEFERTARRFAEALAQFGNGASPKRLADRVKQLEMGLPAEDHFMLANGDHLDSLGAEIHALFMAVDQEVTYEETADAVIQGFVITDKSPSVFAQLSCCWRSSDQRRSTSSHRCSGAN